MRHADIRTTMNIYGDAASADMREAHGKIVQLALQCPASSILSGRVASFRNVTEQTLRKINCTPALGCGE
jgi:hypothetical protein